MTTSEKSKAALRLMDNEDFNAIILTQFIRDGILANSLQDNVRSDAVLDEIVARRILHEYFYGIITSGENLKN